MRRLIVLATALLCLLLPATAFAFNPLGDACGAGGSSSAACGASAKNPISGPGGVLEKVALIFATISGIAAVIIIIVAGFILVTAGGNSQRVDEARNAIIGALVGLAIILVAAGIVTFVVNKL